MARNDTERTGQDQSGAQRQDAQARPRVAPQTDDLDIEAMNTDGKGTGGVGADLGGYGPVPGSETTG